MPEETFHDRWARESKVLCQRCRRPRSEHTSLSDSWGLSMSYVCPTSTFLPEPGHEPMPTEDEKKAAAFLKKIIGL